MINSNYELFINNFINDIRTSNNESIELFYYVLLFTLQNYFIEIEFFEKATHKYIFIKYLLDETRKQINENKKDNKKYNNIGDTDINTDRIFENYNKILNNDIYTKIFIDKLMVIMTHINSIIKKIIESDYKLINYIKICIENTVKNNTYKDNNEYKLIIDNLNEIELRVIVDRADIFINYITKILLMQKTQSFEINSLNNNNRFINTSYHSKLNNIHKQIIILFINYHVCQIKLNFPLLTKYNNTNVGLFLMFYKALYELLDYNNKDKNIFNMLEKNNKYLLTEIKNQYTKKSITELENISDIKKINSSSCIEIKKEIKKNTKLILTLPIFRKKSTIFHRLTRIN